MKPLQNTDTDTLNMFASAHCILIVRHLINMNCCGKWRRDAKAWTSTTAFCLLLWQQKCDMYMDENYIFCSLLSYSLFIKVNLFTNLVQNYPEDHASKTFEWKILSWLHVSNILLLDCKSNIKLHAPCQRPVINLNGRFVISGPRATAVDRKWACLFTGVKMNG